MRQAFTPRTRTRAAVLNRNNEHTTRPRKLDHEEKTMRKPTFVPTPDVLETRVVLSGGPKFTSSGAAILTTHALGETYAQVEKAFSNFARHGENYRSLEINLANAVTRIPFNRRDGLLATVESEVAGLQDNISSGVTKPVVTSMESALEDVHDFVQGEADAGIIVVR
jgi:hypothetical protein